MKELKINGKEVMFIDDDNKVIELEGGEKVKVEDIYFNDGQSKLFLSASLGEFNEMCPFMVVHGIDKTLEEIEIAVEELKNSKIGKAMIISAEADFYGLDGMIKEEYQYPEIHVRIYHYTNGTTQHSAWVKVTNRFDGSDNVEGAILA